MSRLFMSAALVAVAAFGFGCHGTTSTASNPTARVVQPQGYPQETLSPNASTVEGTTDPMAQKSPQTAPTTNDDQKNPGASSPPPEAPVSGADKAPSTSFKPTTPGSGAQPPNATGGGPKGETGGAVYGDGSEGNTGTIKGGDAPNK